jgi:hypothetical protein
MSHINSLIEELKQARDELRLQIHLGSKELQDEWAKLEPKWNEFLKEADLEESAERLGAATRSLGEELKQAYERVRSAL